MLLTCYTARSDNFILFTIILWLGRQALTGSLNTELKKLNKTKMPVPGYMDFKYYGFQCYWTQQRLLDCAKIEHK